jgi:PAS domain S-box-containing protein
MADVTKIDTFIQRSPHPAWLATTQGHCVYANPALERLTGFNSDQINQADWRSFLLEEDRAVASASWQRSLVTGTPYRAQVRMRGSDGARACLELIAFGHKAGDGPELWLFSALAVNGVGVQKLAEFEAQIQVTLNVIPAYTWYALPSGALTFVNERTANYLGLPKDHPLRFGIDKGAEWDSHTALLHPDDREEARRVWSNCLSTGTAGEFTFRVPSAEGKYRWFLTRAEPLRANDGSLLYWIGVNLDIDDAKRAEDALRKSEKELRDVIDTVPALVWSALPDGSNTYANKRFVEYLGLSAEHTAGSRWHALVHPDDLERHVSKWREAVATGKPHDNESRYRRSDGQYRWHLDRGMPLRDEDGNIVKWYGVTTDIEDRKRAEEALQRSEAYLAEAQRLSHTGSFGWKPDSGEIVWSEETYRIFDYDHAVKPTIDLLVQRVHPEDRPHFLKVIESASAGATQFEHTYRWLLPDGSVKHVHALAHALQDASGNREFVGAVTDITSIKRAEEELRTSEAYLAEAQRLSQTGSWAWSPDDDIRYWSEECYRVLSFDPQGGLPRFEEFFQRLHPDDQPRFRELIETATREKAEWEAEYRIVHPDGPVRDIHVVGHPVLSTSGHLVEFVGTVIDVTERRRAEKEHARLRQMEADLAHINRVSTLGEMAASLAHEIKQPIAAAITSANTCIEWLAHEPPNLDRARAAAARIDKYGNRAAEIIDRIRSLYKKSPPQRELVDVNGIIEEMLTLLKGEADRSLVGIRTELSAELPKIMADRVQLQQVFMNLMLNAIEAMKDSGGELTVKSELQDGQLQFSVSDTGVGLPPERMDQIFSAFFTTKPQGSGMGLAISRSIVESHGGRLWATANDGRGATFHFTLPIQVTEPTPLVA